MDLIYRYDPLQPLELRRPKDTPGAVDALLTGNGRLVDLVGRMQNAMLGEAVENAELQHVVPIDLLSLGLPMMPGLAHNQQPFAIVLGCSDARVPIESIFDQSFNDLFVVRIAGNVLGTECIGSFDFAVKKMGDSLKAVVVLGHTGCGAVTAAVDAYLSPQDFADIAFTHSLRSLVDRIMIAVRGTAHAFERQLGHEINQHPEYREVLIETSTYMNAAITAFDLQREISGFGDQAIPVFYAVCDLGSMLVHDSPDRTLGVKPRLAPAPKSADEFMALNERLVHVMAERCELR